MRTSLEFSGHIPVGGKVGAAAFGFFFSLLALVPFTSDFGDACTHLERRSNWFWRKFAERGAFAGGLNQRGDFRKEHDQLILVEL